MAQQPFQLPPLPDPTQALSTFFYVLLLPLLVLRQMLSGQGAAAPLSLPQPRASYSNEERWQLVRGTNGRITEIIVHRDAREG